MTEASKYLVRLTKRSLDRIRSALFLDKTASNAVFQRLALINQFEGILIDIERAGYLEDVSVRPALDVIRSIVSKKGPVARLYASLVDRSLLEDLGAWLDDLEEWIIETIQAQQAAEHEADQIYYEKLEEINEELEELINGE